MRRWYPVAYVPCFYDDIHDRRCTTVNRRESRPEKRLRPHVSMSDSLECSLGRWRVDLHNSYSLIQIKDRLECRLKETGKYRDVWQGRIVTAYSSEVSDSISSAFSPISWMSLVPVSKTNVIGNALSRLSKIYTVEVSRTWETNSNVEKAGWRTLGSRCREGISQVLCAELWRMNNNLACGRLYSIEASWLRTWLSPDLVM